MMKRKVSLKNFIQQLKTTVKDEYNGAIWPIGGFFILFVALMLLLSFLFGRISSAVMMNVMMVMYGMASAGAIGMAIIEIIAIIILMLVVQFYYGFLQTAMAYAYLDRFRDGDAKVTASSIWEQFKRMNKNQVWRILLYYDLFIFLWTLPLDIVAGFFAKNAAVVITCRVLNAIVIIWKSLEYSQALFIYKDQQPLFLGQSMRYSITASRHFMHGLSLDLLAKILVTAVLPVVIWLVVFGGLGYYGIYTATTACIWIGFVIAFIGLVAWLPVMYAVVALYYNHATDGYDLKKDLKKILKPIKDLTGETDNKE